MLQIDRMAKIEFIFILCNRTLLSNLHWDIVLYEYMHTFFSHLIEPPSVQQKNNLWLTTAHTRAHARTHTHTHTCRAKILNLHTTTAAAAAAATAAATSPAAMSPLCTHASYTRALARARAHTHMPMLLLLILMLGGSRPAGLSASTYKHA